MAKKDTWFWYLLGGGAIAFVLWVGGKTQKERLALRKG
jgi:hypothetical protein